MEWDKNEKWHKYKKFWQHRLQKLCYNDKILKYCNARIPEDAVRCSNIYSVGDDMDEDIFG
jgi:hypothetical protein